jgi:hypothetical protein
MNPRFVPLTRANDKGRIIVRTEHIRAVRELEDPPGGCVLLMEVASGCYDAHTHDDPNDKVRFLRVTQSYAQVLTMLVATNPSQP